MHLIKSLLVGAACVVAAAAQKVAFTGTPAVVRPGDSVPITWGGGDPNVSKSRAASTRVLLIANNRQM